ncbi:MAG: amino acid permease [Clostridiales bacterium]|nr:amino acid permease [Clostridiales bacterium]
MNNNVNQTTELKPGFSRIGIWAFSIGTSIGWGSFIITCNTYLQKSGLLGTVFGLLIGMAVILVITRNLQYMIRTEPDAGGIYAFEKLVNGKDFGFIAFWFVQLTYLAILWANITSVPLFIRLLLGDTFKFGLHYKIFGYEVWLGEALLSIAAVLIVGFLCANSKRIPKILVTVSALVFVIGFTVCAIIVALKHKNTFSYSPMYTEGSSAFRQIVRIAAISPWAFIGFENISHFSQEYSFPVKKVRPILIWSVALTTLLYIFVSVLSVSAYPPEYASWLDYIRDMGNLSGIKAVPAFFAADHYLGKTGVMILAFSLFGVILTSLIGNMLALSRILFAAGRDGEAPRALSFLNKKGIPVKAIYAILTISVFIPFLGRTAIGWIVDVTTLGATLIYLLISHAVFRHATQSNKKTEKYTGIAGIALMLVFLVLLLVPGLLPFHAMETESYVLFIFWSLFGLGYYRWLLRKDTGHEYGKRIMVWILLLVLVTFASMMWVSRETENAANKAVHQIFEYHESHSPDDSIESVKEDRIEFLEEQAKKVSGTNTLYTVVSLGLFLVVIFILLNNYRDTQKLGKRLIQAEKEVEAAKKIAQFKESVNMYTHIARSLARGYTDIYYINLEIDEFIEYSTEDENNVLTEIRHGEDFFDYFKNYALKFVYAEDREMVSNAMERREFLDSLNRNRVFMLTYRNITDKGPIYVTMKASRMEDDERFMVLGITDVDEHVRHRREVERMYEERLAYSRMNALTGDYLCVYVVEPKTGQYHEFSVTKEFEEFALAKDGDDFFGTTRNNAGRVIYKDDLNSFLSAFTEENVLSEIVKNGMFSFNYRLVMRDIIKYVQIKAAIIEEENGKKLIIGVNDIDSQIRQEQEQAKRLAQAQKKANIDALTGIKNRYAYLELEKDLDRRIAERKCEDFAVIVADVNNLKEVNDTLGHKQGDRFISDGGRILCDTFSDSSVFRIGGDEFAVIVRGVDYDNINSLLENVSSYNRKALESGGVVIACGMSIFSGDSCVASVFERADRNMYRNKVALKSEI